MSAFWTVEVQVLCPWCNRTFSVMRNKFNGWLSRITFCCFCGHVLGATEEQMADLGYEKDAAK
jgi:hypothetical protein